MPGSRVANVVQRMALCPLDGSGIAREAKVSTRILVTLSGGGTCEPAEADRIEAVLARYESVSRPESDESDESESG